MNARESKDDQLVIEQLSAYLDGELNAEDSRRVEERLARDADYHQTLQTLERSWRLLDRLPRAEVGEEFTRTTIEMVALRAQQERNSDGWLSRRTRRRIAAVAAIAAASLGGLFAGKLLWPDPNQQLLSDLPVIQDLDLYEHAESVDFLKALQRERLFAEEEDDGA